MAGERTEISIPVQPWYKDHCFGGRIILAAVEAILLLAATVKAAYPHIDVRVMQAGRFAKLLEIPPEAARLDAVVELERGEKGEVCARLLTRTQLKTLTRMTTHCELTFAAKSAYDNGVENWTMPPCAGSGMEVTAEEVYRNLVPFGPAYRTLQDRLFLEAESAWGTLWAPELVQSAIHPLGSPFPLDGAMHAACVHGQRLVDFVPFPVGFAERYIAKPTHAGERYRTQVQLHARTAEELVYNIRIFDQKEQVRETIKGLRMRDVSGGRIRPPAWIKNTLKGTNSGAQPS
jgi:hypothetical protein